MAVKNIKAPPPIGTTEEQGEFSVVPAICAIGILVLLTALIGMWIRYDEKTEEVARLESIIDSYHNRDHHLNMCHELGELAKRQANYSIAYDVCWFEGEPSGLNSEEVAKAIEVLKIVQYMRPEEKKK